MLGKSYTGEEERSTNYETTALTHMYSSTPTVAFSELRNFNFQGQEKNTQERKVRFK